MRCIACNKNLTDFESTRKMSNGAFLDLCNHCASVAEVNKTEDRVDLVSYADYMELEYYEQDDGFDYTAATGERDSDTDLFDDEYDAQ